jgi:hypothetical protein
VQWANQGWGGHVDDGAFIYVNPLLSLKDATTSMQPLIDYVQSLNGSAIVETSPTWLSFFTKYVITRPPVCVSQLQGSWDFTTFSQPTGRLITMGSRLIPAGVFEDDTSKESLVDILMDLRNTNLAVASVNPVLYNATSPDDTSVTPAWRNTVWHVWAASPFINPSFSLTSRPFL